MNLARFVALTAIAALSAAGLTFTTAAVAGSAPAKAGPVLSDRAVDAVVQETADYGDWLLRLNTAASPAIDAAQSLQAEWGAALQAGNPSAVARRFRPTIARGLQGIVSARQQIAAIETPTFARLNLPPDLQSVALRDQMQQTVNQLEALIVGFNPLLDAMIANDQRAAVTALSRLLGSTRTLYETQLLFARANLATAEPGTTDHAGAQFEIAYFETGSRLIAAASNVVARRPDPTLSADLLRFADRIDVIADAGIRAAEASKEEYLTTIGDVQSPQARRVLDAANRIDEHSRRAVTLWRGFAVTIRQGAQATARGPLSFQDLRVMTDTLGPLRQQLDAIGIAQAQALVEMR